MTNLPNLPKRPMFDEDDDGISLDFNPTDGSKQVNVDKPKDSSKALESSLPARSTTVEVQVGNHNDIALKDESETPEVYLGDTVAHSVRPEGVPADALYNNKTGEYFDATTGLKIDFYSTEETVHEEVIVLSVPSHATPPPKINKNVPDNIEIEDWTEDDSTDPSIGLGAEKDNGVTKITRLGKGFAITERDVVMMKFLARYRYAYVDQIARLVNAEVKDIKARLRKLEREGLVRSESITAGQEIFLIRKAGLSIVDMDFPEIKKGSVSFITVAHTVGLVNLAVELEMATGGKNILGEEVFPKFNRYHMGVRNNGELPTLIGEMTITEREIRRSNRLFRGSKTTEDMRIIAREAVDDPEGPELLEGNEGLFVVYGTGKDGEHVPDLVVARPRGDNGEVQHIAIELELTPKNNSEWARILRWYRDHGFMYDKIYYFTHKRTLAEAIKRIAVSVGMEDKVVVRKYIPQNDRGPFWG